MLRVPIDQYWDDFSPVNDVAEEEVEIRKERPHPLNDLPTMTQYGYDGGDRDSNSWRQQKIELTEDGSNTPDLVDYLNKH